MTKTTGPAVVHIRTKDDYLRAYGPQSPEKGGLDLPEVGPCEIAWNKYQESLGNLTEIEEARVRRAFLGGWIQRSKKQ